MLAPQLAKARSAFGVLRACVYVGVEWGAGVLESLVLQASGFGPQSWPHFVSSFK